MISLLMRTGVVTVILAINVAAHAAVHGGAPNVAAHATPVATTPSAPAVVPAVMAPPSGPATIDANKRPSLSPATPAAPTAPIVCSAPAQFSYLDRPLLHTARRLANGKPLTIVAIGSSSTAGAGATSPAASYPSRLGIELKRRLPDHDIGVLNRGVNGEETDEMMARFNGGVIAEHPQLVLWQIGTNSVLHDRSLKWHSLLLHQGIEELKATGADLVLIDPQYAPKVIAKSETPGMVDQIALAAKDENIDLFHRFAVMRNWSEVMHLGFAVFVSPDGLHMNDWSYACMAKLLAGGIVEAATRPIASAAVGPSH
ncbi:MAG TPA: SGNH/GDSL hydrolase family protein [Xanthobacteraceae bacterium]|jgi:lysophospholipase L1-like esterase